MKLIFSIIVCQSKDLAYVAWKYAQTLDRSDFDMFNILPIWSLSMNLISDSKSFISSSPDLLVQCSEAHLFQLSLQLYQWDLLCLPWRGSRTQTESARLGTSSLQILLTQDRNRLWWSEARFCDGSQTGYAFLQRFAALHRQWPTYRKTSRC